MKKIEISEWGDKYHYWNDQLHREDGPAVEYATGLREWWIHNHLHREGGPAIEFPRYGRKEWWIHSQRHREDGPAIEWGNGVKEWYLNGKEYTEEAYWRAVKLKALW